MYVLRSPLLYVHTRRVHTLLRIQVRADWKFQCETFNVPAWNAKTFCWRCRASREELRHVSSTAAWRARSYTHFEVVDFLKRSSKKPLSPLFRFPFFNVKFFTIDWLHTMDQGVTQHFIAAAFDLFLERTPGPTQARQRQLWEMIQEYYKKEHVVDRLQKLTPKMVKQPGDIPKLRGSAACVRALVGFARELVGSMREKALPNVDAELDAAFWASASLVECYAALGDDGALARLPDSAKKFAIMLVALEEINGDRWAVRPKLHNLLHLAELGSPAKRWVYRDEDFGGSVAGLARRKGGQMTPSATSSTVLWKFLLKCSVYEVMRSE